MKTYIILIRGINVGGKNKISMMELKKCLEEMGFIHVLTYLASGNVLLNSDKNPSEIQSQIEKSLPKKFMLDRQLTKVLVLTHEQLQEITNNKPKGFGDEPEKYHSDAIFLMRIAIDHAMPVFKPKEGVDRVWPGKGVIYSQRLSSLRTQSRLSRIVGTKAYQSMTIRTWNTTTKLLALMESANKMK